LWRCLPHAVLMQALADANAYMKLNAQIQWHRWWLHCLQGMYVL
jgi:hypothetical protein